MELFKRIHRYYKKVTSFTINYRTLTLLLFIIFVLSIIPMFAIGMFDVPSSDDFGHCIYTYHTWKETGSIFELLKSSIEWTKVCYNSIGGTFAAYFFDTICPSIFGENCYFITPIIILSIFFLAQLYLTFTLYYKILKFDKHSTLIIFFITIIISTQFLPSAVQGFYWYVGAFTYTVFFSFMIIVATYLLNYLFLTNIKYRYIMIILISLLSFLVGGGNYVSSLLLGVIFILLFLVYSYVFRKIVKIGFIFPFASWLIAFLINILAPGNNGRKAMIDNPSPGIIKGMLFAFKESIMQIDEWSSLSVLCLFALLVPILWFFSSKSNFDFRAPIVVSIISFLIISSMLFPPIYSMNNIGEGRLQNIVYFMFVILTPFNMYYWFGWFSKHFNINCFKKKCLHVITIVTILSICVFGLFTTVTYPVTSVSATKSLLNGDAEIYKAEAEYRFEILHSKQSEVLIPEFTAKPYVLFTDKDILPVKNEADTLYGRNEAMSDYYSKESVLLISNNE